MKEELLKKILGYHHPQYASSYREWGEPVEMPHCGGAFIKRAIPEQTVFDGMGCYPFFVCQDPTKLHLDLEAIEKEIICFSMVTNPLENWNESYLKTHFKDKMTPFKKHYLVDLNHDLASSVDSHHMRNVQKASKQMKVELCQNPKDFFEDWNYLYRALVQKHEIKGMLRFSESIFKAHFEIPGLVVVRASVDQETVGMLLWYVNQDKGYYHLGAFSEKGYELNASFALFYFTFEQLKSQGVCWVNLGSGAGLESEDSGLARFKKGWATNEETVYFCGRILNSDKYEELVKQRAVKGSSLFPAYRADEIRKNFQQS